MSDWGSPLVMKYGSPTPRGPKEPVAKAEPVDVQEVFLSLVNVLGPLAQKDRERILRSVAVFYGVTL
jgi:hypothetical protein